MKLWRKLAKKQPTEFLNSVTNIHTGEVLSQEPIMKRNGRDIAYQLRVNEMIGKTQPKTYPLLDALIQKAGIKFIMTKKEEAKLQEMIASANKETDNETV